MKSFYQEAVRKCLFAQTFRYFHKPMLAILSIWLCLVYENASILDKNPILGQPPGPLHIAIADRRIVLLFLYDSIGYEIKQCLSPVVAKV